MTVYICNNLSVVLSNKDTQAKSRSSCYTNFVLKNVTISLNEEALLWARRKAAENNTSVSRLVGQMLEREMGQRPASYWAAFEDWKAIMAKGIDLDAANRLTREEANERPRNR